MSDHNGESIVPLEELSFCMGMPGSSVFVLVMFIPELVGFNFIFSY